MDAFKLVAGFDPQTGLYTGLVPAFLSPLESSYPLPMHAIATLPDPAQLGAFQAFRLNAVGSGWDVVPDYSQTAVYHIRTAQAVVIAAGQTLPADCTLDVPPSSGQYESCDWTSASGWRLVPDFSHATVYDKATALPVSAPVRGASLPASQTLAPPPAVDLGHAALWNADTDSWDVVPDLRGMRYWLPDGSEHTISRVGEMLPADALNSPPAPTLASLREQALALLPDWELRERAAGIEHAGRNWLTTPAALQDVRDALLAGMVPGDVWADANHDYAPMSLVDLQSLWAAMVARGAEIYRRRLALETEIEAMATDALIALINSK